jgi:hypothetical protein
LTLNQFRKPDGRGFDVEGTCFYPVKIEDRAEISLELAAGKSYGIQRRVYLLSRRNQVREEIGM